MILKNTYNVSLCKNGLIGGMIYLKEAEMIYCTNKLTVPEKTRRLHIMYNEIAKIKKSAFHTITIYMETTEEYKFLVFSRKSFIKKLNKKAEKLFVE